MFINSSKIVFNSVIPRSKPWIIVYSERMRKP
ncbi:MAG: hypothetical protein IJ351_05935 [Oscillospiraceae bacterium]|nr:hypothetical protein [Oscillospiraceae bacterium]